MPTPVLRLAALLFGLTGPPGTPAELPATGEVVTGPVHAFVEPDETSVMPVRFRKGDTVRVVDADPASGWLTIEPPSRAFDWVERSAVHREGPGVGRVVAPRAVLRVGVAGARMPGPPRSVLNRGDAVSLLDLPELTVGTGRRATTWLAVRPPKEDVLYLRAEAVAWKPPDPPPHHRETLVTFEDPETLTGPNFPPEIAAEVAGIEADHRAILNGPTDLWRFDAVRARYLTLLKRVSDPATTEVLRARLDQVARHEEIGQLSRTFQTILDRSRRRDKDVAMALSRLAELDRPTRRPFVAEGLVQASSREVEGRRVYALIGPAGEPIAYLDVPPGLDARSALTKRVGVRGSVRYNESLGSRLITVKDLEPLD